jgi:MFS transporter, DHA3 family, macrolide efflux protein
VFIIEAVRNTKKNKTTIFLTSNFYYLIGSESFSRIGIYIYQIAIPLLILELTNSTIWMGLSFGISQLASFFGGVLSGKIIDTYNKKKVLLICYSLQACLIGLIPILFYSGHLHVFAIIIIGFILNILSLIVRVGGSVLLPSIVSKSLLPIAAGQTAMIKSLAKILGPILAGLVLAYFSEASSLFVTAILLGVSLSCVIFMNVKIENTSKKKEKTRALLGLKIIYKDKTLFNLVLFNFFINLGFCSMFAMLIFHLSETVKLSSSEIGFLFFADGIGVLIAGTLITILIKKIKSGVLLLSITIFMGILIFLLSEMTNFIILSAIFGLIMLCVQIINRTIYTIWQANIDKQVMGRVFSVAILLENLAVPIAGVSSGIIVNYTGSIFFMKICSGLLFLTLIYVLFSKLYLFDGRSSFERG